MLVARQILVVCFPLVQKGIHELWFRIHRLLELLPTDKGETKRYFTNKFPRTRISKGSFFSWTRRILL